MADKKWKDTRRTKEILSSVENSDSVVFYDLETSGRSSKKDRVLQFAAIRYDIKEGKEIDKINLFIKCPFSIPKEITEINHITDELLEKEGMEEETVIEQIKDFIKESDIIAGYNNNSFDDKFMENLYREYGYEFGIKESIDVYKYAKMIVPPEDVKVTDEKTGKTRASYKLSIVAGYYHCDEDILFHDAFGDVTATIEVFKRLILDGKKYMEEDEKKEEDRKAIPRQDANLLSISYFSPSQYIKRVYINTDQGTFFYDDLRHEWRTKEGNIDSIDMEALREKTFKAVGVTKEEDLFKEMKKKNKINII